MSAAKKVETENSQVKKPQSTPSGSPVTLGGPLPLPLDWTKGSLEAAVLGLIQCPDSQLGQWATLMLSPLGVNDAVATAGRDPTLYGRLVRDALFTNGHKTLRPQYVASAAHILANSSFAHRPDLIAIMLCKLAGVDALAQYARRRYAPEQPASKEATAS